MERMKLLGRRCAAFLLAFAVVVTSQGFGCLDGILCGIIARAATTAENFKYDRVMDVSWDSDSEWIKYFGVTIVSDAVVDEQGQTTTHGVIELEQWNTVNYSGDASDANYATYSADLEKGLTVQGTVTVGSNEGDTLQTTKGNKLVKGGVYDIHLAEASASSSLFSKAPSCLTEVTLAGDVKDADNNVTSKGVTLPDSLHSFFQRCKYLKVVNMNGLDVRNVISMDDMFYNCPVLTTVHMQSLNFTTDTSNLPEDEQMSMDYMFSRCPNLDWVDFRNSDLHLVQSGSLIFNGSQNLRRLTTPAEMPNLGQGSSFDGTTENQTSTFVFYAERVDSELDNATGAAQPAETRTAVTDLLCGRPYFYLFDESETYQEDGQTKKGMVGNTDYFKGSLVQFNTLYETHKVTDTASDYNGDSDVSGTNKRTWAYTTSYFKSYSIKADQSFNLTYLTEDYYLYDNCLSLYNRSSSYYKKYSYPEDTTSTGDYSLISCNDANEKYALMDTTTGQPIYGKAAWSGETVTWSDQDKYYFVQWTDATLDDLQGSYNSSNNYMKYVQATDTTEPTNLAPDPKDGVRIMAATWKESKYQIVYHSKSKDDTDETVTDSTKIDSYYSVGYNNAIQLRTDANFSGKLTYTAETTGQSAAP